VVARVGQRERCTAPVLAVVSKGRFYQRMAFREVRDRAIAVLAECAPVSGVEPRTPLQQELGWHGELVDTVCLQDLATVCANGADEEVPELLLTFAERCPRVPVGDAQMVLDPVVEPLKQRSAPGTAFRNDPLQLPLEFLEGGIDLFGCAAMLQDVKDDTFEVHAVFQRPEDLVSLP